MSRREKKEWNLDVMLSVVGFVFELIRVTVNALRARNGSVDDLRRLLREPALVDEIFDLIVNGSKTAFPIWKTITLGLHKNADEYCRALYAADFHIGIWADSILGRITFSAVVEDVNLVIRSVAELGFANGATFAQICDAAKKLGLSLCSAEVGPALREQYRDQPIGEWLVIAMEPITDSGGCLGVFVVERGGGGLWLGSACGGPGGVWFAGGRFVFGSGK